MTHFMTDDWRWSLQPATTRDCLPPSLLRFATNRCILLLLISILAYTSSIEFTGQPYQLP